MPKILPKNTNTKTAALQADSSPTTPMAVCAGIISNVVEIYVLVLLTVFPLFATDKYFDILVDKYYFFWICTAIMLAISLAIALGGVFIDANEHQGEEVKSFFRQFSPKNGKFKETLKLHFRAADWFLLIFLAAALLSTICSEWKYESFWGNMGRYQGLFTWFWYAVMYFMITRFFKMKQWYLDVFLIVGLYMAIWGIQDYLGLDPHGWLMDVDDKQKNIFTSSIGNINTYTAVIGLYMAVSSVLFVTERSQTFRGKDWAKATGKIGSNVLLPIIRTAFYGISAVIFFVAMITGQSDNAVLGVLALLCFLPFYAWRNRRGMVRYVLLLAGFFFAMLISRELTLQYPNPNVGFWSGTLLGFCEKEWINKLFFGALGAAVVLYAGFLLCGAAGRAGIKTNRFTEKYNQILDQSLPTVVRWVWLGLGVLALCGTIWLFWDANHGGHPEWYAPYANIFYFNNDWGTHRGHNWSILISHFSEFPFWKKLIGSGPETYGIFTRVYNYKEMVDMYGEIYDSPHNEFLQYLFTTGILGFIGYYGFIAANCIKSLNIKTKASIKQFGTQFSSPCAVAGVFAAVTYTAQSFINISVPIVVPLLLIILFMGSSKNDGN